MFRINQYGSEADNTLSFLGQPRVRECHIQHFRHASFYITCERHFISAICAHVRKSLVWAQVWIPNRCLYENHASYEHITYLGRYMVPKVV